MNPQQFVAKPPLADRLMLPFVAGSAKFASSVLAASAWAADTFSHGVFPKNASNFMRKEAQTAAAVGKELGERPASKGKYGDTVKTAYDLLPLALAPGVGGTGLQMALAGGGASARKESVPVAVGKEGIESLVRPFRNPATNKIIGELLNSDTLNKQ